MAEYTIIPAVELVSVGMKWQSANGPLTFTFDHLNDAMVAANEDPHVVPPRAKLGHTDPRFADEEDPGHDPFYDGDPALGSFRNLRLVNDGATLIGDWIECPVWLAEAAPSAYPSRSIEGAYTVGEGGMGEPVGEWDVTTPGGKHYSFVLTACAALGVTRPAVADLEDLRRFLTEGEGIVVAGSAPPGGTPADASIPSVALQQAAVAASGAASASADVEKVIDAFMSDYATEESGRYWWWPRAVWTDPNELIVDDDEGGLYSVSFTSDDKQNVSFGEPSKVLQTFEPAPAAAAAVAAQEMHRGKPAATFAARSDERLPSREKDAEDGGHGAHAAILAMDFTTEQRGKLITLLSLPEDATDEQIVEKLEEDKPATPDAPPSTPEDPNAPGAPVEEDEDGDGEPAGDKPAASADATVVPMDRATHDQLLADAALGRQAREQQITEARTRDLDAAISAGKIMPSSKADWERKYKAAPEATRKELEALAPGLVPVTEQGHSIQPDASQIDTAEITAQLFPHLAEEAN